MVGRIDVNHVSPVQPAGIGNLRVRINTPTTFYINPVSGKNSNSGATAALAWLDMTPLATLYDVQTAVTLQWVTGTTYTDHNFNAQNIVGNGSVTLQGDTVTPSNVTLNAATSIAGSLLSFINVNGLWTIQGFKLTSTLPGINAIFATGAKVQYQNMEFSSMTTGCSHIGCSIQAQMNAIGPCTISGGAGSSHVDIEDGSVCHIANALATMTLTGTPAFTQLLFAHGAGTIIGTAASNWTGSASAGTKKYAADLLALIDTGGTSASLPGGTPGTPAAGALSASGAYVL